MKITQRHVVVTTTCNTSMVCEKLVNALLKNKLAACVQVSEVDSHYCWEGKVAHDSEYLLTIKTRKNLLTKVEACIRKNHTYEVPQIIAYPMLATNADYMKWMDEVTS